MPKHRTSFVVTLETGREVKPMYLAKMIRIVLGGQKVWFGQPCEREGVPIVKVSVTNRVEGVMAKCKGKGKGGRGK